MAILSAPTRDDTGDGDEVVMPADASAALAPGDMPTALQRRPMHLSRPVDVRSLSLGVLAVLGTLFALQWASAVLIPVMLGLMLSYALSPIVDRLQRPRVPRALAAGLVLVALLGGFGWMAYALSDDAAQLVESLPEAAKKVRQAVRAQRGHSESAVDKVQAAAAQLEQAAQEGGPANTPARGVMRVQIERPQFNVKDYVWSGTLGVFATLGQAMAVLFIAFFLLAAGDTFRRKIVRIAGPTFAQRKITVQMLDEITQQIQRYLLVQVLLSGIVGLATWWAFLALGVEHSAVWGAAAFALNFVPYLGALALTGGAALVGFMQFGRLDMALLIGGASLLLHVISGQLLAPWLTSKTSRLNTVSVFIGVLAFGWLWGVSGLLLGVPILMMVKAACDRVDSFRLIGELLGT